MACAGALSSQAHEALHQAGKQFPMAAHKFGENGSAGRMGWKVKVKGPIALFSDQLTCMVV